MNKILPTQPTRADRLSAMTNPPPQKERKPANLLWIAYVFFNVVALLLDIAAMLTVKNFTNWLYGILVFMAGFVPLMMHEQLFTRAYASTKQRILSVIGIVASIGFILTIGIIGGILNVMQFNPARSTGTEILMIVILVCVAIFHGILAGVYFFIDAGIRREQVRTQKLAYYESLRQSLQDTKQVLQVAGEVLDMEDEITHGAGAGNNDLVNKVWGEFIGRPVFNLGEEEGNNDKRNGKQPAHVASAQGSPKPKSAEIYEMPKHDGTSRIEALNKANTALINNMEDAGDDPPLFRA